MQPDTKQNFIFIDKPAQGMLIHLNTSLEQILDKHDYPLIIKKILSEAIISNLILFSNSKTSGSITLQFLNNNKSNNKDNEISFISVKCNSKGQMRALAQYDKNKINHKTNNTSQLNILEKTLKNGSLSITFEPDTKSQSRYQSFIPVNHGSISEAMESYFTKSVQNPTKIIIQSDIKNKSANISALMLQFLPNSDLDIDKKLSSETDNNIDKQEQFNELCVLADSLYLKQNKDELQNSENSHMLKKLFFHEDIKIFDKQKLSFVCGCSKLSMEKAIISLGKDQALELINQQKQETGNSELVATCEFCLNKYEFNEKKVIDLFKLH